MRNPEGIPSVCPQWMLGVSFHYQWVLNPGGPVSANADIVPNDRTSQPPYQMVCRGANFEYLSLNLRIALYIGHWRSREDDSTEIRAMPMPFGCLLIGSGGAKQKGLTPTRSRYLQTNRHSIRRKSAGD